MVRRMRIARFASGLIIAVSLFAYVPDRAGAFAKAIWGPVQYRGADQFPLYRQLGVNIYQMQLHWNDIATRRPRNPRNPRDPAYSWPLEVGQAVAEAKRFHIRALLMIIGTPGWANGGRAPNWVPKHPRDLAEFATAAARKYSQVHQWMIWGEPTRTANFEPLVPASPGRRLNAAQRIAPHLYARMLDASYGALKSVSRRNLVIGGNTYSTGYISTVQWIDNLRLPNGRRPRMDIYGHNPFTARPPNFSNPASPRQIIDFSDLQRLGKLLDRKLRRGLPLFLSEWGVPTAPDQEFNFYVDPPVAAQWTTDALRLSRRWHRIYALGWVHAYDIPPAISSGLLTVDGTPKATFFAFEHG